MPSPQGTESEESEITVSDSAVPWTVARQAPLSMGLSRQEDWSGLPFPSSGDVPNPGIELASPTLQETLHLLSHQEVRTGDVLLESGQRLERYPIDHYIQEENRKKESRL